MTSSLVKLARALAAARCSTSAMRRSGIQDYVESFQLQGFDDIRP